MKFHIELTSKICGILEEQTNQLNLFFIVQMMIGFHTLNTSEITRDNKEKDSEEVYQLGLWIATEDIIVVNVLTKDKIRGINKEIDEISKDFENLLKNQADENAENNKKTCSIFYH